MPLRAPIPDANGIRTCRRETLIRDLLPSEPEVGFRFIENPNPKVLDSLAVNVR